MNILFYSYIYESIIFYVNYENIIYKYITFKFEIFLEISPEDFFCRKYRKNQKIKNQVN